MPTDQTPPKPSPPPGRTAAPRPPARLNGAEHPKDTAGRPLTSDQYMRLQGLRAAVDLCRNRPALTDQQVLTLADRFTAFIRTGNPHYQTEANP